MTDFMLEHIVPRLNYWIYVVLMMMGLWAMIAKRNLVKKLIGMAIFQTGIILFYVSIGVKIDSTIPILLPEDMPGHYAYETSVDSSTSDDHRYADVLAEDHGPQPAHEVHGIQANAYANPLPHVLMLTAIVVGVATLGLGLAVVQKLYKQYGTIEENEILAQIQNDPRREDAVQPHGYGGQDI